MSMPLHQTNGTESHRQEASAMDAYLLSPGGRFLSAPPVMISASMRRDYLSTYTTTKNLAKFDSCHRKYFENPLRYIQYTLLSENFDENNTCFQRH